MPRTVSMRKSYQGDVAHLTSLAAAVEKDETKSDEWRKKTVNAINRVILVLLNVDGGED